MTKKQKPEKKKEERKKKERKEHQLTIFHPTANPTAGSIKNSACLTKLPVTGNNAVVSPKANCTLHTIQPTVK